MGPVAIALLGRFELRVEGALRELPGAKDRALLAVLALPPGAVHPRDELAALLWSDRSDSHARDSLKHALARLRTAFGVASTALVADRSTVRFDPTLVGVDTADVERLLLNAAPDAIEAAVDLYRGELIEGVTVRDAAFEEWLLARRREIRARVEEGLAKLLAHRLAEGELDRAAAAASRLAELDPFREDAVRGLMRVHAARGQPAQAMRLHDALRDRLHRELGVRPGQETAELVESIREGRAHDAGPPTRPDRPSIAVLPFQNLGGDPEQDYFADGIVDEIITALSRMRWLFVIARNSSFAYKGRAVDVKEIARDLGVLYLLEGSVRSAAGRVRITAALIDTDTGAHLWADAFEGELADIFELQDQVTASVVGAIAPELERAEIARARRKPTGSLDAYDYFLRGLAEVHKWKREANDEARRLFAKAIESDPDFAAAWGMAARCLSQRKASGWVADPDTDVAEARRLAWRAAELGAEDAVALATAGIGLAFVAGDIEDGRALLERAIELNPNLAMGWLFIGWANVWSGEPEVALGQLAHAMRLSPHDPQIAMMQAATAVAHFFAGRDADAIHWARMSVRTQPNHRIGTCILAASLAWSPGGTFEATKAMDRLRIIDPALRLSNLTTSFPVRRQDHVRRWTEGLRRAGLPE